MGLADRKALQERRKRRLGLPYILREEDAAFKKKGHPLWELTESPSWSYAPLGAISCLASPPAALSAFLSLPQVGAEQSHGASLSDLVGVSGLGISSMSYTRICRITFCTQMSKLHLGPALAD